MKAPLLLLVLLPIVALFGSTQVEAKLVTFTGGDYDGYQTWNWTAMTHLAFWTKPPPPVVALAKSNNVSLIILTALSSAICTETSPTYPRLRFGAFARMEQVRLYVDSHMPDQKTWANKTARAEFASSCAATVKANDFDGVFFDYEGNSLSKDEKAGFGDLAKAVSDALSPLNATLFVCVAGRPTYEWRDYPYADLADASEFLFIMGYDMHL